MLVCHCHSISDKTIRKLYNEGLKSLKEIQLKCKAGTRCKCCVPLIEEIIEEESQNEEKK
jgi:bacterioferritin-associated ferredoxin